DRLGWSFVVCNVCNLGEAGRCREQQLVFRYDGPLRHLPVVRNLNHVLDEAAFHGLSLPPYWLNEDVLAHRKNRSIEVCSQDEVANLQEIFDETFKRILTRDRVYEYQARTNEEMPYRLEVVHAFRSENAELYLKFAERREEYKGGWPLKAKSHGAGSMINERLLEGESYLAHGTNPSSAMAILKGGFKLDHAGSATGTMFGNGVYMAECVSKSDEYARDDNGGTFPGLMAMLICRSLVGDPYIVQDPGDAVTAAKAAGMDCVVGTYREFIFFDERQVYPEYAVIYRRQYEASKSSALVILIVINAAVSDGADEICGDGDSDDETSRRHVDYMIRRGPAQKERLRARGNGWLMRKTTSGTTGRNWQVQLDKGAALVCFVLEGGVLGAILHIMDSVPVPGLQVPLPGSLNDEMDRDLDEPKRAVDQGHERHDSPKKQKPSEEVLNMASLRGLLAEQSMSLLQAQQQQQISAALSAFEERQSGRMDRVESKLEQQGETMGEVQEQIRELQDRLAKVEKGGGPGIGAGPDRKSTLVFGGWAADTRKGVLLEQLDQALKGLQLQGMLDTAPFTTGARRSVALCQFKKRAHESDGDARQRMLRVIQVINASQVKLEGAVRPLWASFSKSPEERGRAALAAVVRKAVLRMAPQRMPDLDVEYPSGCTWIKEDQISGMGAPPDEVHGARIVSTKGGSGWLDERTLSKWLNVELGDLQQLAIRDSIEEQVQKDDLVLLQEVPREREGWTFLELEGKKVVTHRADKQWRGTGLWYDQGAWCVLKKHGSAKGTWFKLRHLEAHLEIWVGTSHFTPGCNLSQYEVEVQDHFDALPGSAHRVAYLGDVNTGFTWTQDGDGITIVPKEGKGGFLHQMLTEKGFVMGVPDSTQLRTPTSRYPRHETGPRMWIGGVEQIDFLDQSVVESLAATCTKQVPGRGYKDSKEVKQAFQAAKRSGTAILCKKALKMRKEARRTWEQERLVRASEGDWVYAGVEVPGIEGPWKGEVQAFTVEELREGVGQLKRGKSVGADRTSTELILGLMQVPGGESHLLEWYNRILATQVIPEQWNRPILVMLPKIRAPKAAKDLRPIAMGSAVSKLFSRLLLNRALPHIRPFTSKQCCGPTRQTADYLFSIIRMFELAREWGVPFAVFKLDLEKAFDKLDRTSLLNRLEEKLGAGPEMNCWRGLLRDTVGILQTPWGRTEVAMNTGIKQGAVESPSMFAWVAELALAEAIEKYSWHARGSLFADLPSEEMLYMDDGMLWQGSLPVIQTRVEQLAAEFSRYGLRLNPRKCQLYASPKVQGDRAIRIDGQRIEATDWWCYEAKGAGDAEGCWRYSTMVHLLYPSRCCSYVPA
ncbi:Pol, partial [Symbiodinium necroappetens]